MSHDVVMESPNQSEVKNVVVPKKEVKNFVVPKKEENNVVVPKKEEKSCADDIASGDKKSRAGDKKSRAFSKDWLDLCENLGEGLD